MAAQNEWNHGRGFEVYPVFAGAVVQPAPARRLPQPERLPAISRGLSESASAPPPVHAPQRPAPWKGARTMKASARTIDTKPWYGYGWLRVHQWRAGYAGAINSTCITKIMNQDSQKISAWSDYRSRRRWFFGVWLGGLPAVFYILGAFNWIFHPDPDSNIFGILVAIVAGTWMISFAILGLRLTLFRCPCCGEHFFCNWFSSDQFARRCVHCGLPKWAERDADDHYQPPKP